MGLRLSPSPAGCVAIELTLLLLFVWSALVVWLDLCFNDLGSFLLCGMFGCDVCVPLLGGLFGFSGLI